MKENPSDHVKIVKKGKKGKEVDTIDKKPWRSVINFVELGPLLPQMKNVSGPKKHASFHTFEITDQIAQSIFERCKHDFQTRAQVDRLAHYIGAGILEQVFLVMRGHKRSKLSLFQESQEENEFKLEQMELARVKLQKKIDLFTSGIITNDKVYEYWDQLLECFASDEQERLEDIFNDMLDRGEAFKSKDRVRKRAERRGFRVVEGEE